MSNCILILLFFAQKAKRKLPQSKLPEACLMLNMFFGANLASAA